MQALRVLVRAGAAFGNGVEVLLHGLWGVRGRT